MYVEDQDEDIEEEEEFHEVEEEKHKTSQESVGTSGEQRLDPSPAHTSKISPVPESSQQPAEKSDSSVINDAEVEKPIQSEKGPEETCVADVETDTEIADAAADAVREQPSTQREPKLDMQLEVEAIEAKHDTSNSSDVKEKPDCDKAEPSCVEAEPSCVEAEPSCVEAEPNCVEAEPSCVKVDTVEQVEPSCVKVDTVEQAEPSCVKVDTVEQVSPPKSAVDWANIMMHSKTPDSDSAEETSSSDKVVSDTVEKPLLDPAADGEDTIDGIIEDTQAKLKIADDSNESLDLPTKAPVDGKIDPITAEADPNLGVGADAEQVPSEVDASAPTSNEADQSKEEGDKSNDVEKKELDLDEDVKNPQYIPKKGVFYEHDDRSHDADEKKSSPTATKKEDENTEAKETSANKKVFGSDKPADNRRTNRRQRTDADRWGHDLFRNEKQKPKSKSELINAYGYDIRQERGARNQTETRAPRIFNNTNTDRAPAGQDGQRSRQSKDSRGPRQVQPSANNDSRERKPRRQNTKNNRGEGNQGTPNRRDVQGRQLKAENTRDLRETLDEKHAAQSAATAIARRDRDGSGSNRNARNDSRGRRRTSRDRPNAEDARLPPPNTVMPPITTWSSEDMMIAEAFGKKSPPQAEPEGIPSANTINNTSVQRDRPTDGWQQGPASKPLYQDRLIRNQEENRQQSYNPRSRYQDRGDENHRPAQFSSRTQYHDRTNQQHDWNRAGNFSPHAKPNDYVVKTQTFENSRLSQSNHNRSNNNRDLRDVINERRGNNQQNFQNKVQHNVEHHANHRTYGPGSYHQQYTPTQHYMHPHHQQMVQGQSHMPLQAHQQQAMTPNQLQQPLRPQQQSPHQVQAASNHTQQQQQNSHAQQPRQPPTTQPSQPITGQSRQNLALNSEADNSADSLRSNVTSNNDPMNSRPIVKTDAYTGGSLPGHQQHSQSLSQHSQNHRSIGGPMAQPGAVAAGSHIVPSHIGAGSSQPQYYQTSSSSRDPTAAIASAYHGYIPGGHPVMDPSRYHMTSQQLSDHGYIASGQASEVSAGTVLHQQGLYTDTSATGAMANTAYLTQAGSSLSPTTNIPVTGSGTQPLAPVSYIQHSQYPPPPYSNPYSQPQLNQPPPQSGHAYPYWAYI